MAAQNNLFKTFAMDENTEKVGVWLSLGPVDDSEGAPNMRIRIGRAGGANIQYEKRRAALLKPYNHQLQSGIELSDKIADPIMRQLYAETIVKGWENIAVEEDGDIVPYSIENCIKLFENLPEVLRTIREFAAKQELFRKSVADENVKN